MGKLPKNVLGWLLESSNPSIKYRTLVELLDYSPSNTEVQDAYEEILKWKPIRFIKKSMQPDGYWQVKVDNGKIIGKGTEYRTFNTTHWVLGYLAEYGLTRKEKFIEKAANRYLNLQKKDGDFWQHLSCLYGLNLHTFARLGYNSDERIKETINLALSSIRHDNGYLCDLHNKKKKKGKPLKSCYRGALKVLFGFCEYPTIWNHDSVKNLINYFLDRDLIYKTTKRDQLVVKNADALVFPFTYREGLIEILYPLLKMGHGDHPNLEKTWSIFETKKMNDNKFPLDWIAKNKYLKLGKIAEPNKWATFYAYLLYKLKTKNG
jgi:hypothetical protein